MAAEGNILCEHGRVIQRSHKLPPRTIYDWLHYLAVAQRKPGALRNGAPFMELPSAFRQLQDHMLRSLKMYGMPQAVTALMEQGAPAFDATVPILSQLLKAELAKREVRSIADHMKSAFGGKTVPRTVFWSASPRPTRTSPALTLRPARSLKPACASCTKASSWMVPGTWS